jgi:hypothetical protein
MPENETQPFGRNTCHICGGTEFTWGSLHLGATVTEVEYMDADMNALVGLTGFGVTEKVRVRKCQKCQNIQLFGASEKKKEGAKRK